MSQPYKQFKSNFLLNNILYLITAAFEVLLLSCSLFLPFISVTAEGLPDGPISPFKLLLVLITSTSNELDALSFEFVEFLFVSALFSLVLIFSVILETTLIIYNSLNLDWYGKYRYYQEKVIIKNGMRYNTSEYSELNFFYISIAPLVMIVGNAMLPFSSDYGIEISWFYVFPMLFLYVVCIVIGSISVSYTKKMNHTIRSSLRNTAIERQPLYDDSKYYVPYFKRIAVLHIITDVLVLVAASIIFFFPLFSLSDSALIPMNYSLSTNLLLFLGAMFFMDFGVTLFIEAIFIMLISASAVWALVNLIINIVCLAGVRRYTEAFRKKLNDQGLGRAPAPAVMLGVTTIFTFLYIIFAKFGLISTVFFGVDFYIPVFIFLLMLLTAIWILIGVCRILNKRMQDTSLTDKAVKMDNEICEFRETVSEQAEESTVNN